MEKSLTQNEENKKRAAFKRFSQLGVAGLAVISASAFTTLAAQQQLPKPATTDTVKTQNLPAINVIPDNDDDGEIRYGNGGGGYYQPYSDYSNYCNYQNYYNYSNSNNNYTNNYGNNYSNYGDYSNYSNYGNYSNYADYSNTYGNQYSNFISD